MADRAGHCYQLAYQHQKEHGGDLVHGYAAGVNHAWVEHPLIGNTSVYEPEGDRLWNKDDFLKAAAPVEEHNRYSRDKAVVALLRSNHYGPWQGKTAAMDWRPGDRMFAPGKETLDPRLFDDNDVMRPQVSSAIVGRLARLWDAKYPSWRQWTKVFMGGSEATYWWGNNDFDCLIGIDYPTLKRMIPTFGQRNPGEIADCFNAEFRQYLNDENFRAPWDGETWHLTYYNNPNSYDIRNIKPYAAYDILDQQWIVRPPEAHGDWGPDKFPNEDWRYVEDAVRTVQEIMRLPQPGRSQRAAQYWHYLHSDRQRGFGPYGGGFTDRANVVEKALDMHPDHLLTKLIEAAHQAPKVGMGMEAAVRTSPGPNGEPSNGMMVALIPPMEFIEEIALEEGEHPDAVHLTLAYLGKMRDYSEQEVADLPEVVQAWAEQAHSLHGRFTGVGTFVNPDEHVLWVAPDVPGLPKWREALVDHLTSHGYHVADNHGFQPHVTIAYGKHHFRFLPKLEPTDWPIHEIFACVGERWESFPLGR